MASSAEVDAKWPKAKPRPLPAGDVCAVNDRERDTAVEALLKVDDTCVDGANGWCGGYDDTCGENDSSEVSSWVAGFVAGRHTSRFARFRWNFGALSLHRKETLVGGKKNGMLGFAHILQLPLPLLSADKPEAPRQPPPNDGRSLPYHIHVLDLKCSLTRMARMGICLCKFGPNLFVRDVSGPWQKQVVLPPSANYLFFQTPSHNTTHVWLVSGRDLLQPWMAENMPYRTPRKVFREFNPRCQKLHFTFSSLPSNAQGVIVHDEFEITPLHGSVRDSTTQTLHTGWSTPVDREVLLVKFK